MKSGLFTNNRTNRTGRDFEPRTLPFSMFFYKHEKTKTTTTFPVYVYMVCTFIVNIDVNV